MPLGARLPTRFDRRAIHFLLCYILQAQCYGCAECQIQPSLWRSRQSAGECRPRNATSPSLKCSPWRRTRHCPCRGYRCCDRGCRRARNNGLPGQDTEASSSHSNLLCLTRTLVCWPRSAEFRCIARSPPARPMICPSMVEIVSDHLYAISRQPNHSPDGPDG